MSSMYRTLRLRLMRASRVAFGLAFITALASAGFAAAAPGGAKPVAGISAATHVGSPPTLYVAPVARVTAAVDNSKRVVLQGGVSPAIANAQDLGSLSADTSMQHMIMVLRASTDQDQALKTLLDQQLDGGHPNYHHWLTPDEFGAALGVADADITKVTDWLTSQGLTVEQVMPGKRFIQFSGTAGTVATAFQTQMHQYRVGGQTHISNNSNISVPAALAPVIAGVPTLNDFFKTSQMRGAHKATQPMASLTGKGPQIMPSGASFSSPDFTNGTTHYTGAGDFAAIYNTTPLLNGSNPKGTINDGTGVSVGVVGRTDINLADVQIYRQMFNLKNNDPNFIVVGEDPGVSPGDDGESYLDVEVSGGAAPGATIDFVEARATLSTDGVDLAAMYIVQNNLTDIISESYGNCEGAFGSDPSYMEFYANLWGQAAAQGQSVFVSSGDNGAAGCDSASSSSTSNGFAVSLLASSPYDVAVGGTEFADTTGTWWSTTATASPPFASALGYIPENAWNEAKGASITYSGDTVGGLWSSSGGISAWFVTPSWQQGDNVPSTDPPYLTSGGTVSTKVYPTTPYVGGTNHRYMPDVSLPAASGHDGTLYCAEGICQLSSSNTLVNAGIVGGTSVAAPTMAGVQALIDQYNGGRQGQPNYVYYALAAAQATAGMNCVSNSASADLPNCAFHDVTTGNNYVCTTSTCTSSTTTRIGWNTGAGYDLATGLGSPNAYNLATLWSTVTFNSTTTSLNLSQTSGTHGQTVTASGTVAPGSGTGIPTGQVSFLVSTGALGDPTDPNTGNFLNDVPLATLDGSGNYNVDLTNLPGGTYTVIARYGGDGTYASSTSAPVSVTVAAESATVTIEPNSFNGTACTEAAATTFTYGSYVWTDVVVAGASGQGVPTGTVSITDNGNAYLTAALNPNGEATFLSGAIASSSCVYGYTFQNAAPLTVGTHVLGAAYSGDTSFGSATATPVTVTITPATITGTLTSGSADIASGDQVLLSYTLAGLSSAGPGTLSPTGTVTFTDTTTSTVLGTATLSPTSAFGGIAVLSTNGITSAGANSITATYAGDANYNPVTNSAAVTVTVQASGTATTVAVTSNANPTTVGGRPTWTATVGVASGTAPTSGTVSFYDTFNSVTTRLGTGTVGAAHTATYRPAATVNLPAGLHQITAVYGGTTTFNASTSAPFAQTFTQMATTANLTVLGSGTCSQTFALQATLGLSGTSVPAATGTMDFYIGSTSGTLIGSAPFTIVPSASGGYGLFTAQTQATLAPGSYTIVAAMDDPNYTATSNTQTITTSCTAPSIVGAFSPANIQVGGTSMLTFTIANPNVGPMTGVAFTDSLPAGLVVANPANLTNTCGGAVVASGDSISLSNGAIATNSQCSIGLSVQGTLVGVLTNTTSVVTADQFGAGNSTTATLTVIGPPSLAESFGVASMPLGASTNLQFTVTNPNATASLTGIGFADTLPAGLVVATPNGLSSGSGDCQSSGGTVTAAAGSSSISLGGASLSAGNSCTFSLQVTSIQAGTWSDATTNVSSNEGGNGNSSTASVVVFVPSSLSATGSANPGYGIVGDSTQFTVAVTGGTNPASTGIAVTADLSSIGGSGTQTFVDNGDGTFGFNATIGSVAPGQYAIPVSVSDAQGRTATTTISYNVLAQGALGGSGAASPSSVALAGSVQLFVSVSPGSNPTSTGITVTADLSALGGSSTQQFANVSGNLYSFSATVADSTALGTLSVPVTISDANGRSYNTAITFTVVQGSDEIFYNGFESN